MRTYRVVYEGNPGPEWQDDPEFMNALPVERQLRFQASSDEVAMQMADIITSDRDWKLIYDKYIVYEEGEIVVNGKTTLILKPIAVFDELDQNFDLLEDKE